MNLAQPPAIPMMHGRATASIREALFPAERDPEFENIRWTKAIGSLGFGSGRPRCLVLGFAGVLRQIRTCKYVK
jgi:hypothetical protein